MNVTRKERTKKTISHAKNGYTPFLSTLLVAAAAIPSSGQAIESYPPIDLQRAGEHAASNHLSDNSADLVFKMLLNALLQLFDLNDETQPSALVLQPVNVALLETANSLINGYVAYGLDPTLTAQEVDAGIADCNAAIAMLKDPFTNLSLSQSTQDNLQITIGLISGELNSAY